MKKIIWVSVVVFLFVTVLGFSGNTAHALLLRTGVDSSFVVVDEDNGQQWADLNRFGNLTYDGVLGEVAAMNTALFAGAADWHLASLLEMEILFGEILTIGDARQFDPTLGDPSINYVLLGRYALEHATEPEVHIGAQLFYDHGLPDASTELTKNITVANYADTYANDQFGAWVVSSAPQQPPVPEPSTLLLLGAGLIGLLGIGRKRSPVKSR